METKLNLPQSLSESNLIKAVRLRRLVSDDIVKPSTARPLIHHLLKIHIHTLQLHSLKGYRSQFRTSLERSLMDEVTTKALADAGTLNWCKELRRQFPLKVSGVGNSLPHSLSLSMWGVQDTDLTLSKTLHEALTQTSAVNFRMRWQTQHREGQPWGCLTGLIHQTEIWDAEWQNVIDSCALLSPVAQGCTRLYQDIHLFVLANIIRRPIIVITGNSKGNSKKVSDQTLSPAGIYLPLHWPASQCYTYPILLSYTQKLFTPLISVDDPGPEINAFPLVVPGGSGSQELPVRFLLDEEQINRNKLLSHYLVVIPIPDSNGLQMVMAARLQINPLPNELNLVQDYFQLVNHEYRLWQEGTDKGEAKLSRNRLNKQKFSLSNLSIVEDRCLTPDCSYFCSKFTKPFCHTCQEAFQREAKATGSKPGGGGGRSLSQSESQSEARAAFEPLTERSAGSSSAPPVSSSSSSSSSSPPRVHFFAETDALKCRVLRCPFTGSPALDGLCPGCSRKRNEPGERVPDFPNPPGESCGPGHRGWGAGALGGLCPACSRRSDSRPQSHVSPGRTPGSGPESLSPTSRHPPPQPPPQPPPPPPPQPPPPPPLGGRDTGHLSSQCIKPNCQYFGTEEQFGYCTVCFLKHFSAESSDQQEAELEDNKTGPHPIHPTDCHPTQGQRVQISSQLRTMSLCRTEGCCMLANPAYSGYCEKCYVSAHSKSSQSASDTPTEPAAWSPATQRHPICGYSPPDSRGLSDNPEATGSEPRSGEDVGGRLRQPHCLQPLPSARPKAEPGRKICRTRGCEHFGNAKCDGYCNACSGGSRRA